MGNVRIWDTPQQSSGHWALRKELKEDELQVTYSIGSYPSLFLQLNFLQGKPVNNLILHPDQKRLFVQSRDGVIRVVELRA